MGSKQRWPQVIKVRSHPPKTWIFIWSFHWLKNWRILDSCAAANQIISLVQRRRRLRTSKSWRVGEFGQQNLENRERREGSFQIKDPILMCFPIRKVPGLGLGSGERTKACTSPNIPQPKTGWDKQTWFDKKKEKICCS